jgi:hypothetical protein
LKLSARKFRAHKCTGLGTPIEKEEIVVEQKEAA